MPNSMPMSVALLSTAEMAEADRRTIAAGTPGIDLMESAGAAVARAVLSLTGGSRRPVRVFCGPGNNGGDGLVAARILRDHGLPIEVGLLQPLPVFSGDAGCAANRFGGPFGTLRELDVQPATIVVDALFGAGLSRSLAGEAAAAVDRINHSGAAVIAVDIPSGVEGNSGAVLGTAVRAHTTITFFKRKPGHLLWPGRGLCGTIVVADIGISETVLTDINPSTFAAEPPLWCGEFPRPHPGGHKYDRGHALVLSGDLTHTGAARLSARAALRTGAGLVTLLSPANALAVNAAHLTAIMLMRVDDSAQLAAILADHRKNVLVLGPAMGVGRATRDTVIAALANPAANRRFVLDADALTSFADAPSSLCEAIRKAATTVTLTPHEGEFNRLFGADAAISSAPSKLSRARNAAAISGAIVVLKGPDTVIAHPDGRAAIQTDAPADLATAGSGDVLSGIIAGLAAQAMPAFLAEACATLLHARAAACFGPGLIAEDLPEMLPKVLAAICTDLAATHHPLG
jgi:ADP-dependent NAD(P)H-hydrate dehydratase / NAD(P)H-hydrate epimerase